MNIEIYAIEKTRTAAAEQLVLFINKKEKKRRSDLRHLPKSFNFYSDSTMIFANTRGIKNSDDWRMLGYNLIKFIETLKCKKLRITEPKHHEAFFEGLMLGGYSFDNYKSTNKKSRKLKLYIESVDPKTVERAVNAVGAQCLCRDMVNGTPEEYFAESICDEVERRFEDTNIRVQVYDDGDLFGLDMHGHLAVNRASPHPAMTIKLTHEPEHYTEHIVLVGKGLTYDSGGLSIKTGGHMLTMKCDKAGAMAVFGIMDGLAWNGSGIKVTAYMGMAENVIDGSAYKPDDVLTMKNGKTVHVKNTDAEGRIVLFDNLCLAEEENPDADAIFTLATLTGASVAMYGSEAGVMVGTNKRMKRVIRRSGKHAGEIFCEAEIHKHMLAGIKDSLADLSNMGTPNSGCQKAGLFLMQALSSDMQKKYLHLDIAGASFAGKPFDTNCKGGTGFAVRTFLELLT